MNATKKLAASIIMLIAASVFAIPALTKQVNPPAAGAEFVLYYGNTCPHCKTVETFIEDNKIKDKLDIASKEIFADENNRQDMAAKAAICGFDTNTLYVPMLWDSKNKKCYGGQKDKPAAEEIINFLKQKTGSN